MRHIKRVGIVLCLSLCVVESKLPNALGGLFRRHRCDCGEVSSCSKPKTEKTLMQSVVEILTKAGLQKGMFPQTAIAADDPKTLQIAAAWSKAQDSIELLFQ